MNEENDFNAHWPRDRLLVILAVNDPSPLAFLNLYEPGDFWIKIQGCEKCSVERSRACCGAKSRRIFHCPHVMEKGGCALHQERNSSKPFHCVVGPTPNNAVAGCALIYRCTEGKWIGHERHVTDRRSQLRWNDQQVQIE